MEPEGSLLPLQAPVTCTSPQPDQPSPCSPPPPIPLPEDPSLQLYNCTIHSIIIIFLAILPRDMRRLRKGTTQQITK
jgi:hypothetical protein